MRALLVVNPAATTTTPRMVDVLISALGHEAKIDITHTSHRGHAVELGAQATDDGFDVIAVLGGDGTINEVINGLLHNGPSPDLPALAVVPGGSTNVFARSLGIPGDPVEATGELLTLLRSGQTRRIGLGRADERYFTFTAGLGLDADAVRLVEIARAKGKKATPQLYATCALRRFMRTDRRHPTMTITRPGAEPIEHVFMAVVSNTSPWTYIGSRPVTMTPSASFDTGLDAVALTRLRTIGTIMVAGRLLTKKGIRGRAVTPICDIPDITVTATKPQPFQIDGDYLGERESVHFTSAPSVLRVIA